jgi:hypothetical protein
MFKRFFLLGLTALSGGFFLVPRATAGDLNSGLPQSVLLNVPFTTQAPLGEWNDPRQRDGCEEASIKMGMMWAAGAAAPPEEVRRDIINLSEYEKIVHGFFEDTSAADTAQLMHSYYNYQKVSVTQNISTADIKAQVAAGNLVITPLNTRNLKNKIYRRGPVRHMVVVTGYDNQSGQIIINDPLFVHGAGIHIPEAEFNNALEDYATGRHLPVPTPRRTAMIVISK